mmetsp:Transcript_33961/g.74300  ORF Transcript_33961/g.74300 Transcript_33961/m.74300 type:complete len:372 (-) Transcript_33961:250-1365(-)
MFSSCSAYTRWLAVKTITSNFSATRRMKRSSPGRRRTFTMCSWLLKCTGKVKSALLKSSNVECTSVSSRSSTRVIRGARRVLGGRSTARGKSTTWSSGGSLLMNKYGSNSSSSSSSNSSSPLSSGVSHSRSGSHRFSSSFGCSSSAGKLVRFPSVTSATLFGTLSPLCSGTDVLVSHLARSNFSCAFVGPACGPFSESSGSLLVSSPDCRASTPSSCSVSFGPPKRVKTGENMESRIVARRPFCALVASAALAQDALPDGATVVPELLSLKSTLAKVACKPRLALDSFVVTVFSSVDILDNSLTRFRTEEVIKSAIPVMPGLEAGGGVALLITFLWRPSRRLFVPCTPGAARRFLLEAAPDIISAPPSPYL